MLPSRETIGIRSFVHGYASGLHKSPEYNSYCNAKARCTNPKAINWDRYGGRGITFEFKSFTQFIRCLGPKPSPIHSLERIDNMAGYNPSNCRWATPKEQRANSRLRKDHAHLPNPEHVRELVKLGFLQKDIAWAFRTCEETISYMINRRRRYGVDIRS
jgi:hypothetical protein